MNIQRLGLNFTCFHPPQNIDLGQIAATSQMLVFPCGLIVDFRLVNHFPRLPGQWCCPILLFQPGRGDLRVCVGLSFCASRAWVKGRLKGATVAYGPPSPDSYAYPEIPEFVGFKSPM